MPSQFMRFIGDVAIDIDSHRRKRTCKREDKIKARGCRFKVGDVVYQYRQSVKLYFLVAAPGIPGSNQKVYVSCLGQNYKTKRLLLAPGMANAEAFTKSWWATRQYKK